MKILHVLHNSRPLLCGYSIRSGYIVDLQRQLGLKPAVVSSGQHPNGTELREAIDGIDYWRTPSAQASRVPFLREGVLMRNLERRVEAAAREFRPDVIHAHSPVLVGLPALRVARRMGIGFVYEIRDLWENASVDRGRFLADSRLYRVARGLETYVLSRADAVVAICELLKHELAPRAGADDKVHVVANGVDTASFAPCRPDPRLRSRWKLDGKEVILYAGTFQPYEGLDLLVRAIARVVRRRPAAHLVFVGGTAGFAGGDGAVSAEERQLRDVVRDEQMTDHVTFTGRIPHADVMSMYALSDVIAYPRRLTLTTALTTPLKPLEAMAMGKAVLASDIPPMRELIVDGITGLLFKASDVDDLAGRCVQLLTDAALRERLGEGARNWVVRERQWGSLVAKYPAIYESVRRPLRAGAPVTADARLPASAAR